MLQQMNLTTKGEKIDLLKHKCFNSRGSAKQCRVAQRSPQELFYDLKKERKKCVVALVAEISMAFRQRSSGELICSIAMSRGGGNVDYAIDSAVDPFARSASIIALM